MTLIIRIIKVIIKVIIRGILKVIITNFGKVKKSKITVLKLVMFIHLNFATLIDFYSRPS